MPTLEEYYDAKSRRDGAQETLRAIAAQLRALAQTLERPDGVRLTEHTDFQWPAPNYVAVDQDALVSWPEVQDAVRAFVSADRVFREAESQLTPEQQRHLPH